MFFEKKNTQTILFGKFKAKIKLEDFGAEFILSDF